MKIFTRPLSQLLDMLASPPGVTEAGLIVKAWERLLQQMDRRKLITWSQVMGDGTFCPAKRGAGGG